MSFAGSPTTPADWLNNAKNCFAAGSLGSPAASEPYTAFSRSLLAGGSWPSDTSGRLAYSFATSRITSALRASKLTRKSRDRACRSDMSGRITD